ncbi:caprin homolog [Bradysia coprophila]|uniref:caprin homolog n=1 Tax=Bradysia coprophila TaxID=38358 RepID=UPI00187DCAA0|nr:caprin homolog [Bradysia coprophila]
MPSASSNVKVEKQQSSNANAAEIVDNNKLGFDGNSAIGQVYNSIAHKIRNLEKRKGKLESYRDTEKSGKELSNDQKVAVSKYNEVTQTLEFAREFQKQIQQIATVSEKELKKKQKKDEAAKRQNEANKIREVLVIQDILNLLTENEIRDDFLNGANGACQLEKNELDILDKFQSEVTPKHPNAPEEVPFRTAVQKSADHFLNTIDGKPREFGESKYSDIKNIFKNIQKCGYFDKAAQPPVTEVISAETTAISSDVEVQPLEQDTATETEIVPQDRKDFHEAPAAANLPAPTFPPPQPHLIPAQTPQIVQQVSLVQSMGPLVGMARAPPIPSSGQIHQHLVDVQAVEQGYFKNQYIRPIADVIGPGQGNFYFLQDSELDSPEVVPGNYPQPQQQQPPNSQISPNQPVPIPAPPPGVAQPSPQQILPATQLSTQTFNNQSFQNIVPPQMYTKPIVDHIPGFVPPVAISLVVPNHQQKEQSSQMNTNQSQVHANNSAPISFQPTNQQSLPKAQRHRAKDPKQMKNDQRVPEITEWKPEDAAKPPEEMTEWRDQYATAVTDWNEDTNEDSTWSNNNRYQYRNNGGSAGNGSRDRNNRGSRPPGNAPPNGYRNRQSNSYQSNGGRQSGSGGERAGNGSFYRSDNFYSNGSYNKQDKQDGGGYRGDNKQDGGFKGGNFRSRDSREQVNGSMRTGGGAPRNVRNGDSVERDRVSNRNTAQNPRPNNKGGNSYGSASRPAASSGNGTRPQSTVNA